MKFCTVCGAQNRDDNVFCSSCGQKLESGFIPNQSPISNISSECQITFKRPQSFYGMANVFHVKVDNAISYELKNGGEVKIPMSQGQHSIEISVFAMPKKKQFTFQATNNVIFICKYNPATALTLWATPVTVVDCNGREF